MVLDSGKYKGVRISEVYKNDKDYLISLLQAEKTEEKLKKFIAYFFPDLEMYYKPKNSTK